jgi:hypothetical protein
MGRSLYKLQQQPLRFAPHVAHGMLILKINNLRDLIDLHDGTEGRLSRRAQRE